MNYGALFFITLFCTSYTMEAEKKELKQVSTKGIISLFHESDEEGIEQFNSMHYALVERITSVLPQNNKNEFCKQSRLAHDDLKQLRHHAGIVGVETFFKTLITQNHEWSQAHNLQNFSSHTSESHDSHSSEEYTGE